MARPTKQGIDYFPIDCQFDEKIEMYIIETGALGLSVLITIWQMIYQNEGYFVRDNKDTHLLIKKRIDVGLNDISDCIKVCLERDIFDLGIAKKHKILTSRAVQKRYFEAAKKKKVVYVVKKYLLISIDSYENTIYSDINEVSSGGNATKEEVKEEVNVNELFIEFWSEYPKKVAKQEAFKSFKKNHKHFTEIMESLSIQKKTHDWTKENGKYIPHATKWLNNKRWEDEIEEENQDDRFKFLQEENNAA